MLNIAMDNQERITDNGYFGQRVLKTKTTSNRRHLHPSLRFKVLLHCNSTRLWLIFDFQVVHAQNLSSRPSTLVQSTRCQFHQHFTRAFCTNMLVPKLQSWNVFRESCVKHYCTINVRVKCWWNWLQTSSGKLWMQILYPTDCIMDLH